MPNNDFLTKLESLMENIGAEPDAFKRFSLIQSRDALLANHAPAIARLVRASKAVVVNETDGEPYTENAIDALRDALNELEAKP